MFYADTRPSFCCWMFAESITRSSAFVHFLCSAHHAWLDIGAYCRHACKATRRSLLLIRRLFSACRDCPCRWTSRGSAVLSAAPRGGLTQWKLCCSSLLVFVLMTVGIGGKSVHYRLPCLHKYYPKSFIFLGQRSRFMKNKMLYKGNSFAIIQNSLFIR